MRTNSIEHKKFNGNETDTIFHYDVIVQYFHTKRLKRVYIKDIKTRYVIGYLDCSYDEPFWERSLFVIYDDSRHIHCSKLALHYYNKFFKDRR